MDRATPPQAVEARRPKLPPLWHSLSARLLVMTVFFVMLGEVFIYAPSIAAFRVKYLEERVAAGNIAVLAVLATPDFMVDDALEAELLSQAGVYLVGLARPDGKKLILGMEEGLPPVDAQFDLRQRSFFGLIGDAFMTIGHPANRVIRVVAVSPKHPQATVEIVMDEAPMRDAMLDYSRRILALSIVISLITAALVYLTLQWWMVAPIRRMTQSMVAFRDNPEDLSRPLQVERRSDEIGLAQTELVDMQAGMRSALHQQMRLAALGAAVTKISHDLRNMLATAQLVSDRLAASADPQVKRAVPTLAAAIGRAVELCTKTLEFTREGTPPLVWRRFALSPLVDEVAAGVPGNGQPVAWRNETDGVELEADRDQLYRVIANLGQNAAEAGATAIAVRAKLSVETVAIEMLDNGPGLPPRARENLFKPFAASGRSGGTGLGLAIARELARAHGGDLGLVKSDGEGTLFRIELPRRRKAA
jgi:signal transduction histidine kinase